VLVLSVTGVLTMVSKVVESANLLFSVILLPPAVLYPLGDCRAAVIFPTASTIRNDRLLPKTVGRLNCDSCRFSRDANAFRVAYLMASLMSLGETPDILKDSDKSIVVPPVGVAVGKLVGLEGTEVGCPLGTDVGCPLG
jgi:hypothetical protein